jgi:hypothetical protein
MIYIVLDSFVELISAMLGTAAKEVGRSTDVDV